MKTKGIAILILITSIFIAGNVLGQIKDVEGWRQARWGMTETQILEAFKGEAIRLDKIDKYYNHYASVGINNINISGKLFNVRFLMDDYSKVLIKINITPVDKRGASISDFDDLKKRLIEKYGQPSFDNDRREQSTNKSEVTWNYPTSIIDLTLVELKGIAKVLVLSYRGKDKGGSDKL